METKESKGKKVGKVVKSIGEVALSFTSFAAISFVGGVVFRVGYEMADNYLKNKNN
jgi:hypothetical protein